MVNKFLIEIIRKGADFEAVESDPLAIDPLREANQDLANRIQLIYKYEGSLSGFFDRASKEQTEYETSLSAAAETRINRILETAACAHYQRANSEP